MRAVLLALALLSTPSLAQERLPDIDVRTPPADQKTVEASPGADQFARNKRLVTELVLGETFAAVPTVMAYAGCQLESRGSGGCSIVFPLIAMAAVSLGPGLGVILGGHLYGTHATGSAVGLGTFVGMMAFVPAAVLLSAPGFRNQPIGTVAALMLMTLAPVGGAMLGYELTIRDRDELASLRVRLGPGAIAAVF